MYIKKQLHIKNGTFTSVLQFSKCFFLIITILNKDEMQNIFIFKIGLKVFKASR